MNEGDLIPNITLRSVNSDGMQNFNLVERFQNKKVLVICVPGAFTSTCHNQHLPPVSYTHLTLPTILRV